MRNMVIVGLCFLSTACATAADYEETRELRLASRGIDILEVDNGSGSIDIVGKPGAGEILVKAIVTVPDEREDRARQTIERNLELSLEKDSDVARLRAFFDHASFFNIGTSPTVRLEIEMPQNMHLSIDDGSGSIDVAEVHGDIAVDDGSGSITLTDVGGMVEIDDGSGSINVRNVSGDVEINDGSGSIDVRGVAGSVIVDDGSGQIDVHDVEQDLIIIEDGSGGLDFSNIGGRVSTDS